MNIKQLPEDNQRSKDWRIERLGNFTGSRIAELMKSGRKKDECFGDTAKSLIYEVMAERELSSSTIGNEEIWEQYIGLTSASTKVMQFGIDNEADAIREFAEAYFKEYGSVVDGGYELMIERTGSIPHSTIPNFAASPDAVIYKTNQLIDDPENGKVLYVVEVKCPLPKTFMKYRSEIKDAETLKSTIEQYYYQMQAEMMVTDAVGGFFVMYCPFLRRPLNIVWIERCEESCELIRERLALAEEYITSMRNGR